jgi:hypothetical protein
MPSHRRPKSRVRSTSRQADGPGASTLLPRRCRAHRHQRAVGRPNAARGGVFGQEPGGAAGGSAIGGHQHLVDIALRRACGCAAGLANDANRCRLTGRTGRAWWTRRPRRSGVARGPWRTRIARRPWRPVLAAPRHPCQQNNHSGYSDDTHGRPLPIAVLVRQDNAHGALPLPMVADFASSMAEIQFRSPSRHACLRMNQKSQR